MMMRTPRKLSRVKRASFLVVANLVILLVALALAEGAGQALLRMRPSHEVIYLEPDRGVGWKQVPGLQYTWAGSHWYASDFSVRVQVNSMGFRDHEREISKLPGSMRVALLGDSMVEALQVPLDETAGQLLEKMLNESDRDASGYEVLNFGTSNHGVGQYLLTWEQYASQFRPDYVIIFVAGFHMRRTLDKYAAGGFRSTNSTPLWVRPTFRLEGDILLREPAADFDELVLRQKYLIQREFGGARSRARQKSLVKHYLKKWFMSDRRERGTLGRQLPPLPIGSDIIRVNEAVIRELNRQVVGAGAVLSVLDASEYFSTGDTHVSDRLKKLCDQEGVGYIPLSHRLIEANESGRSTHWVHDHHLNEAGNEILATATYEWLMGHFDAQDD